MRLPPINVLISWPAPNYVDPETRGLALVALGVVFMFLVLIAVLGRYYSRIILNRWFGLDDTMIGLALIFALGMTITVILANLKYGWDRHIWDVSEYLFQAAGIIAFVAKLMFTLAATFTRLSLLCFYRRIVGDSGVTWFKWAFCIGVFVSVAICITFVAETIWLCIPVQAYWTFPPTAEGHCLDEGKVMLWGGIINSIADLCITLLPIPIVMRLQMPIQQRIGVCVLLCLGLIVTVAGVLRTYYIWASLLDSYDETWYAYPLWICAMLEIHIAIICACAPAWKTFFLHCFSGEPRRIRSNGGTWLHTDGVADSPAASGSSSNGRSDRSRLWKAQAWLQRRREGRPV